MIFLDENFGLGVLFFWVDVEVKNGYIVSVDVFKDIIKLVKF